MKLSTFFSIIAVPILGLAILARILYPDPSSSAMPPIVQTLCPVHITGGAPCIVDVLDPSLEVYAPMWAAEIQRRFPHSVAILCHGGDFVEGEWILGTNPGSRHVERTEDVVRRIVAEYPDRTIVLLACNPGHLRLNVPGVWYATDSVWCVPDRALTADMMNSGVGNLTLGGSLLGLDLPSRWQVEPGLVGSIFEFVQD